MYRPIAFAVAAILAAFSHAPLQAQEPCPLAYPAFEFAVPHLDLDECPARMARENTFCRASVANDALHVFQFAAEDGQCLVTVESFYEEDFNLSVE